MGRFTVKIVVAADSFKGTLSSLEAGRAIADGICQVTPDAEVVVLPVADGGEGTVEAVLYACGGRRETVRVTGPLGDPVEADFALLPGGNRAVIEMAAASGLTLLKPDRYDPMAASTYGTGQLLLAAVDHGCRDLTIAVGGSATVDGGCGAAQALGVEFLAVDGSTLPGPMGGGLAGRIDRIEMGRRDPRLPACNVTVLCDVTNPLCGDDGAARVFGPQKGADADQVEQLDRNLAWLASVIQRDLDIDIRDEPGAGAAGGLAGGLVAFAGARLARGVETILDLADIDKHLVGADLVVTGEGRLDAQSMMGKVVSGVAARARKAGVAVIAIAGCASADAVRCLGLVEAYYVVADPPPGTLPAPTEAARLLVQRAAQVFRERTHCF